MRPLRSRWPGTYLPLFADALVACDPIVMGGAGGMRPFVLPIKLEVLGTFASGVVDGGVVVAGFFFAGVVDGNCAYADEANSTTTIAAKIRFAKIFMVDPE
jgi:hypothetical protein